MPISGSADLRKGALVELDLDAVVPRQRHVVFQYNPEELHRRLVARRAGPPREIITFSLVFDATDAMEHADACAAKVGVSAMLATLECMLDPDTDDGLLGSLLARVLRRRGTERVTLLFWGDRCVPVRLTRLEITETQHDRELHPIRATARIRMQVLTDRDVPRGHRAALFWNAHRTSLASLAALVPATSSLTDLDVDTE